MTDGHDRQKLIVGNWKMNGRRDQLPVIKAIAEAADSFGDGFALCLCVPATLLYVATTLADETNLAIGAQDCHTAEAGAHTGDISAEMIADCFASLCIVGHSERRQDHRETDEMVRSKAEACARAGIIPIVCIGETDDENAGGKTEAVLEAQLAGSLPDTFAPGKLVVAYEPIWAIGTGRVPDASDVARIHAFLRGRLVERYGDEGQNVPLLYGGSVKPANAGELLGIKNVDGALVGGASLKADDFLGICRAAAGHS